MLLMHGYSLNYINKATDIRLQMIDDLKIILRLNFFTMCGCYIVWLYGANIVNNKSIFKMSSCGRGYFI